MYLSAGRVADAAGGVQRRGALRSVARNIAPNVVALGAVSLITDVSSEMVTAVLPLYLVAGLGLSPLAFGFLDGLYGGASAFVRLVGGHLADRRTGHKAVAGFGYTLSALVKPVFLVATSVPGIGAALVADRVGKGVRTAPRDALISLSSPPDAQGRAFGVHRAMDTAGALLGPLVAFGVLSAASQRYDPVFMVSFCFAVLGVVVLALFVQDRKGTATASVRATLAVLRRPAFARVCAAALLLAATTVSDAFVYLLLQKTADVPIRYFPLLPVGTAASYLLLAVPLGIAADRLGRRRVFLAGHAVLLLVYALLLAPLDGTVLLVASLALHGAFYAATDGVLMALAGPMLPAGTRAGGLAVLQTGQATAALGCSVAFGAAWTWWGPHTALLAASGALAVAGLAAFALLTTRKATA
ncbi:Major Facilitator Superfamily protein [Actinomadura rubteroloni]|uniref:Major Facilitator Superfamily protein n=1 Tax=Actinomadura rubteroloni TaxID=1926885 RepID=A0A2P4UPM5_9ACTN|nr:MFS transporter [Actinomadura rubteroloni]POM27006.1 Major Facilitator Superfamily protein [Actinomadura rubteroloni]